MDHSNNYDGKFQFAFNDPTFSDCMLQIKVITGPQDEKLQAKFLNSFAKWCLGFNNRDRHVLPTESNEQVLHTKQIHVNSAILASKSRFSYKLFSNGMLRETDPQNSVTIKIDSSETVAFMELLHYMYGGELSSSVEGSFIALVDVMRLSEKFQVVSCTDYCIQLIKRTMTPESATICLEMVSNNVLVEAAKEFLATRYKDVMKFEKELCNLTLPAIEVIFSVEDLQVPSEDLMYDVVVQWARKQFPCPESRRTVLGSCITRFVRFPCLSSGKLKEILACDDLDPDFANDVVMEALFFKAKSSKEIFCTRSIKRNYTRCIYRFDLSLDECRRLKSGESFFSGPFYLGKQAFCLHFEWKSSFGLNLQPQYCLLNEITVHCEFTVMIKPKMDFIWIQGTDYKFYISLTNSVIMSDAAGLRSIKFFRMPWESFIAESNPYFIDEMLHLRAELTIIG